MHQMANPLDSSGMKDFTRQQEVRGQIVGYRQNTSSEQMHASRSTNSKKGVPMGKN